jgi:hypothetical protein
MSAPADHALASVAARYQQALQRSTPFSQSESGDLFLLAPLPDIPERDQRAALAHLVSLGVLSVYRYIDAKPQPAILAVRA